LKWTNNKGGTENIKFGTTPIAMEKGNKVVIIKFLAARGEGYLLKKAIQRANTG
jgi:hypothetical protein